jgi:hypothetical protein
MALKLDILANTSQLVREMKDAGASVEDISDALDKMVQDAGDAERKIKDNFKDLAREADKTKKATADVGDKGFKQAGEATSAFKDEAIQNFSEVASSFTGDVTQMADGVQGLTGGLASALTPGVGIPIAIVGALAGAFLNSWITAAEDSEARVEEMFDRMREAGAKFASESQIKEAIEDLDTEAVAKGMERARDLSIEEGAVLRAMVGDTAAIADIQRELNRRKDEELEAVKNSGTSLEEQKTTAEAINTVYAEQSQWLIDIQKDTDTAGKKWEAVREALGYVSGDVSTLQGKVDGLARGTTMPITMTVDESQLVAAQRRAEAWARNGLKVAVTGTLSGRTWE